MLSLELGCDSRCPLAFSLDSGSLGAGGLDASGLLAKGLLPLRFDLCRRESLRLLSLGLQPCCLDPRCLHSCCLDARCLDARCFLSLRLELCRCEPRFGQALRLQPRGFGSRHLLASGLLPLRFESCRRLARRFLLLRLQACSLAGRLLTSGFLALRLELRCGEQRRLLPLGLSANGLLTLRFGLRCRKLRCFLPHRLQPCRFGARGFLPGSLLPLRLQPGRGQSCSLLPLGLQPRNLRCTRRLLALRLGLCCRDACCLPLGLELRGRDASSFLAKGFLVLRFELCRCESRCLLPLGVTACRLGASGGPPSRLLPLGSHLRSLSLCGLAARGFAPLGGQARRCGSRRFAAGRLEAVRLAHHFAGVFRGGDRRLGHRRGRRDDEGRLARRLDGGGGPLGQHGRQHFERRRRGRLRWFRSGLPRRRRCCRRGCGGGGHGRRGCRCG
ncbi:MAG: hypothetical protein U1E90_04150 [Burkholderiaceae bacterium]